MNINEILWFILLNISNEKKLELIIEYKEINIIKKNKDKIKKLIGTNKDLELIEIEKFKKYLYDEEIGYITILDKEYPENLLYGYSPPFVIFYKGNINLLKGELISIVGARNCSNYGSEVTKIIARYLSSNNITVVSGMALGIDSIAQRTVILESGNTIGVLGCGVDIVYPNTNVDLYKNLVKKGLVISEFLPKTKPFAYNFPRRNRIISGLSKGLIVVEAGVKSGTLITVDYALESNKVVMAVPGSIFNKNSEGCNKLISEGAHVLQSVEDINEVFKIKNKINTNSYKKPIINELMSKISNEPIHLDDILEIVNVDRKVLFELLFEMQNRNEIICLPGNYYAKTI
ncbi:DNA-processing protein DprA [Clostridium sp.]|uniref:DNA-processing protein DprA n=1 Tax=Clostridium sp. TaxID=1506 RepID=UPI00262067CD|nr:DNA-processing protein DprA [Clostridium sp.]